jgi:hypothetical protein
MPPTAHQSDHASAERFAQRRWLIVLLFTLAFLIYAVSWIVPLSNRWTPGAAPDARTLGAGLAWLVWALAVLSATFGTNRRRWNDRQQRVLNDELTLANRASAISVGYVIFLAGLAAVTAGATSGAAWGERLLRTAPALLLTLGIAVPSIVFSTLQWRAAMLPSGDE